MAVGSLLYLLIKEIFVNHNEWEIKKGVGIDHLEVRISSTFRKNKEFWIVRTDGTETDISYTKCLSSKHNEKIKHIATNSHFISLYPMESDIFIV